MFITINPRRVQNGYRDKQEARVPMQHPITRRLRSAAALNRYLPRQLHIRIFLGLTLLFMLVSVPFVYLMANQFSHYAMKQIDSVNEAEITHSRDNAAFIFNKMIGYGFTMYADKSIQAWLSADSETQDAQVEALAAGTKYMTTEPYLADAYLINMRTAHVIDLKSGLFAFGEFEDQEILALAKQPQPSYQRFFVHPSDDGRQLALMIPMVPSGQPSYGYLVLLLNDELMKQYLLKGNAKAGFTSFILDNDGNVMLGSPDATVPYAELAAKAAAQADSGNYTIDYDKESWSVQYALIEPQGWTMFQMAKLEGIRADFHAFLTKMMVFIAGMVVLLLAILFWNSRRTYKPFSLLADQLQTKFGGALKSGHSEGPLDEHRVIRYGIEMLEDRMVRLDASMREHRNVIKMEYLRQWILQGKLISPVEKYLREHTGLFDYEGLYLSVIRINAYSAFQDKYDFASRKLMKYAMGNIAEEIVRPSGHAEAVDLGSDHLALLISCPASSPDLVTGLLENVKEQIRQWVNVPVTVSVSGRLEFGEDIRATYQHIQELTMLRFVSGEDKIFLERDFEAYMRSVQPLADDNLLDELIMKVRTGKGEEASRFWIRSSCTCKRCVTRKANFSSRSCSTRCSRPSTSCPPWNPWTASSISWSPSIRSAASGAGWKASCSASSTT